MREVTTDIKDNLSSSEMLLLMGHIAQVVENTAKGQPVTLFTGVSEINIKVANREVCFAVRHPISNVWLVRTTPELAELV